MGWLTKILTAGLAITVSVAAGWAAPRALAQTPPTSQTRTITNIAAAQWRAGDQLLTSQSNPVITRVAAQPAQPPTLGIYRLGPGGGGDLTAPLAPPRCVGEVRSAATRTLGGAFASVNLAAAPISAGKDFRAGEMVVIGVDMASANRDPAVRDELAVVVTLANGDREELILTESSVDSGVFYGIIPTISVPPAIVAGDCRLSVEAGTSVGITVTTGGDSPLTMQATLAFLVDPFGIVFDSGNGAPVTGTRVTLVDAATGQPAAVFGDDGVSAYPSSVITGETVTDASGRVYPYPPGDYRFPFVAPGTYRLVVQPPAPFTAPSLASPADVAGFRRPDDGLPYVIFGASYGQPFTLNSPEPVRVDIPVDQPGTPVVLRKTVSSASAVAGDTIQYRISITNADAARTTGAVTVTDRLPPGIRLRPGSVRLDGVVQPVSADRSGFTLTVPPLGPGASRLLTYLTEVTSRTRPGVALNTASARDNRGAVSNVAEAALTIRRDTLGERMTIIGRITDGACAVRPGAANGIGGVRVMLADGRYTVTDADGRYHFDGVLPGLHVVQIAPATLPAGHQPVDCARNTRSAGSTISRFVEGRGGALLRADFRAIAAAAAGAPAAPTAPPAAPVNPPPPAPPAANDDAAAAGAGRDWFAGQTAGVGWIFPDADHNPRTKAVRAAVKHIPGQTVRLKVNGKPVDKLLFEGLVKSPGDIIAASIWRGVPLEEGANRLVAEIVEADGTVSDTLARTVHYAVAPMRAELLRDQSRLVADGSNRVRIAVRLTDRFGKPVKHGLTGEIDLPAPYQAAVEADAQQARQLSGLERARPMWKVVGDAGVAFVELEPTTATGTLALTFRFRDERVERRQTIDMWLEPGDQPWTVVGFAAGTIGYNSLSERMEPVAEELAQWNRDARLALYAKGRISGKWLMTLAYDSDKAADEARFGGVIDPRAYYTIYADRTDSRYDAASVGKLYLRLERPQFYALFGDFETGIGDPQLARYQRALHGGKAEYRGRNLAATAFAADSAFRFRREEIQGIGLSGPYALGARNIIANSERVTIETRSRLRGEQIVDSRVLTRHIDYDIDYASGTLSFRAPVLSRSSELDPQFIIAEYEIDGVGSTRLNAGGRVAYRSDDERLRVGATLIRDDNGAVRTDLAAVDARFRPDANTELRAEFGVSHAAAAAPVASTGAPRRAAGTATAWLVEAEHHSSVADLLVYARQRGTGFGVGQLTGTQDGTRKIGADARIKAGTAAGKLASVAASVWQEDYLGSGARRRAARLLAEVGTAATKLRAGVILADDQLASGERNRSTLVQLGGTQQLFAKRLELDASSEFPLGGAAASVDFPTRHRLGARLAVTRDVNLVGSYEIADGTSIKARTARLGFDLSPWAGGRILASANRQDINEYGPRSFAAYGLSQSLRLGKRVTIDASLDGNRTLGGIRAADVLNPGQPVATGGFVGGGGLLTEDFTAVTLGATYRGERWSITGRGEARWGETADRFGATLGALRQLGEGRALGALVSWTRADGKAVGGVQAPSTEAALAELSWAHRPAASRVSWLNKLEARYDAVTGAVAGAAGPTGGPALTIDGNATSRRVLNSLSVNWSPMGSRDLNRALAIASRGWTERAEIALFWGTRYSFDRFGDARVAGWSNLFGGDARVTLGERVDIGASGTVRVGSGGRTVNWAAGPQLTIAPMADANLVLGYNFAGFDDRDFQDSRFSRSGAYISFRLKFDQTSLSRFRL